MKNERLERNLNFAEANMEFEGFMIDGNLREMGRKILSGEYTADRVVSDCLARYCIEAE